MKTTLLAFQNPKLLRPKISMIIHRLLSLFGGGSNKWPISVAFVLQSGQMTSSDSVTDLTLMKDFRQVKQAHLLL
jgi:hypothetical protein